MNVGMAEFSISNIYPKLAAHAWKSVCVRQRVDTFSVHKMWNRENFLFGHEENLFVQNMCTSNSLPTSIKLVIVHLILKTATWFRHIINSILRAHSHDSTSEGTALSFLINIAPWLRSYKYRINDNVSEVPIEIWE